MYGASLRRFHESPASDMEDKTAIWTLHDELRQERTTSDIAKEDSDMGVRLVWISWLSLILRISKFLFCLRLSSESSCVGCGPGPYGRFGMDLREVRHQVNRFQ